MKQQRTIAYFAGAYESQKTAEAFIMLHRWLEEQNNAALILHTSQHLAATRWRAMKNTLRERMHSTYHLAQRIVGNLEYRPFVSYVDRIQDIEVAAKSWPLPELSALSKQRSIDSAHLYTALLLSELPPLLVENEAFPHRRLARHLLSVYSTKLIRDFLESVDKTWERQGRRDPNKIIFEAIHAIYRGTRPLPYESYIFDDADGLDISGIELLLALMSNENIQQVYIYSDPIREQLSGRPLADGLFKHMQSFNKASTPLIPQEKIHDYLGETLYENSDARIIGAYLIGKLDNDKGLHNRLILHGAIPNTVLRLPKRSPLYRRNYGMDILSKHLRLLRPLDSKDEEAVIHSTIENFLEKTTNLAIVASNGEHLIELAGRYADYNPVTLSNIKDDLFDCVLSVIEIAKKGLSPLALARVIYPVAPEIADQIAKEEDHTVQTLWQDNTEIMSEARRLITSASNTIQSNVFSEAVLSVAQMPEMEQWIDRFGQHAESRIFNKDLKALIQHFVHYRSIYDFDLQDFFLQEHREILNATLAHSVITTSKLYLLLARDLRYYRFRTVILPTLTSARWRQASYPSGALLLGYNAIAAAEDAVHFLAPHYSEGQQCTLPIAFESLVHHGRDYRLGRGM